VNNLALKWSSPSVILDYASIDQKQLKREEVEEIAGRFLNSYPGIAHAYTRTQLEHGAVPNSREGKLMQRAFHQQISGDILLVTKPYSMFSSGNSGTTHARLISTIPMCL